MDKKRILQYVTGSFFALAVFGVGAFSQKLFEATEAVEVCRILSDCFLFPAVLLGGLGALSWIGEKGTFDMLSYGFYMVFQRLIHPQHMPESFYEYKVRRGDEQKGWLKHYLVIGLVCLGASTICMLVFLRLYDG